MTSRIDECRAVLGQRRRGIASAECARPRAQQCRNASEPQWNRTHRSNRCWLRPRTLHVTRILPDQGRNPSRWSVRGLLIPKGLCPPAQGCESASYPGKRRHHPSQPRRGCACVPHELIPDVALVPLNVVLAEQSSQLILKAEVSMMFRDIGNDLREVGLADREVRIAALPLKIQIIAALLLAP